MGRRWNVYTGLTEGKQVPLLLSGLALTVLRRLWGDKFVRLADGILNETATGRSRQIPTVEVAVKIGYALVEYSSRFVPEQSVLPSAAGHMTRQEGRSRAPRGGNKLFIRFFNKTYLHTKLTSTFTHSFSFRGRGRGSSARVEKLFKHSYIFNTDPLGHTYKQTHTF